MSKSNEVELKPCPFCKSGDIEICYNADNYIHYSVVYGNNKREHYYCRCKKCGCHYGYGTKDEAIKAWNTRHNEPMDRETAERHADTLNYLSKKRIADYLQKHFKGGLDEEAVYAILKKPMTTDDMAKEICAKLGHRPTEDVGELVEALVLILPLARGYVAFHSVGSNQKYINQAEQALAKFKENRQ